MSWTREQLLAVYANVYAYRTECPACGGPLRRSAPAAPDVAAVVACDACGERREIGAGDDPLRDTFRDYTEAERRAITSAERSRQAPVCPVDGTVMDVQVQRSLGRTSNVVVRCPRCTRTSEHARFHG
jgi:hypothetical protein